MRAYFFGNMYLSSIQQGIQAAHVVGEMFVKYKHNDHATGGKSLGWDILNEWAENHKTMVLLNAGYASEIQLLCAFFQNEANPLPWAYFREEKAALNESLTSVGIILPEEFYEAAKELRTANSPTPFLDKLDTVWQRELAAQLNNYGLAR